MSILNKIMDTMRLNEPDTDEDDGYFDEEYEEEKPARRRLFNKQHSEDYDYEEEPEFSEPGQGMERAEHEYFEQDYGYDAIK